MNQPESNNPYEAPNPYEHASGPPSELDYSRSDPSPLAIISLVLGIFGILMACCFGPFSLPFGLGAVITGYLALQKSHDMPGGKAMPVTGLICGALALLFSIAMIALMIFVNLY